MYSTPMTKLRIVGPKTNMQEVIDSLYSQNIYHVIEHKKDDDLDIGTPFESSKKISELLVITRSILSYIRSDQSKNPNYRINSLKLEENLTNLHEKVKVLVKENEELNKEIKELEQREKILSILEKFKIQSKNISLNGKVDFILGDVKILENLEDNLKSISSDIQVQIAEKNIAVLFENKHREEVMSILAQNQFTTYNLGLISSKDKTNKEQLKEINEKVKALKEKKEDNDHKLNKHGDTKTAELLRIEEYLEEESDKAESPLKFASTKEAFIINGFVPSKNLKKVKIKLEAITKGKIYFEESKPSKDENIPVQLDNPKITKPFEFLLHIYSIPKISELDPTKLVAFTFPFFFGFMLGDFGYGLLLFIAFQLLKKKMPEARPLLNILIAASIGTMIFGVLYGEYFGFEEMPASVAHALESTGIHILPHEVSVGGGHGEVGGETELVYPTPKILERSHSINTLLALSIIIGLIHINIGYFFGFINKYRQHGLKHAIFEKASWVFLEIGIALIILSKLAIIALPMQIGIIVAIFAVFLIYLGEGFHGIIELPSIFSNVVSYARLMAVGFASVQLAIITNQFATDFIHQGVIGVVIGIVILLIGHTINLALGLIGPFLHSLRLHYVEFFSKFFEGGAILFKPFGKKAKVDET